MKKMRIYIDFKNLNTATLKDEYPILVADLLIDEAVGHRILSFIDEHSRYNQIFIAKKDIHKIAF